VSISGVLGDAFQIYRRLFARSVVVAGLVFAVVGLGEAFASRRATSLVTLVSLLLSLVGGLLVQGALVEAVNDLHSNRPAAPTQELYDRTRERLGTLLGASLVYGFGVVVGIVLLIVPGLIAIARWSLIVPLIVIERRGWREAFSRSNQLVAGRTGRVLVLVLLANVITAIVSLGISALFMFLPNFFATWLGTALAGAVTVPYQAMVLTVLYYRLRSVPA
jgi:hypothetical protein